jgi:hypothetical protein
LPIENARRRFNHADNPTKRNSQNKRWRDKNPDRAHQVSKNYRQKNQGAVNARRMKRIAVQRQRTPDWADLTAIRIIYKNAASLTRKTGIRHHVDHIFPLQGELVSGLHVETNLQILSAIDNVKKSNKFPTGILT